MVAVDLHNPGIANWRTVIPEGEGVVESTDIIDNHLLLTYTKDASTHAYLHTLDGKMLREIKLPSVGSAGFSGKKNRKECFYSFSSFTVPGTIYRYDIATDQSTVYYAPKVNFRANDFVSEQVFFTSKDGTKVPMFLTYKKGLKRNGKNPVLVYGYGGFNIGLSPSFSAMRIPFLESGGIYVMVNLRGGNEYGEEWHLAGTKMRKQNVFDDFIAATEWLIAQRYTTAQKVAIQGGSNGGLLVGACMTQRPDLTTTGAIRYLLNNAANVDEALELLKGIDMHSDVGFAHHFAMADASGKSVVVEYVDNQMVVVESPALANHYLCDAKHNVGRMEGDNRYDLLCERYEQTGGVMDKKTLTEAIKDVSQPEVEGKFLGTAWTMVMDLKNPSVTYYSRRHFDNPFHFKLGK